MALLKCPYPDVFFGGARGGGKSDGLIGDWLKHAGTYGAKAHGILFRRTYPELERLEARARELMVPLGWTHNATKHDFRGPDGATLKLRYLDKDNDADGYQGHEYTWQGWDELQNWPRPEPIDKLWATMRSPHGVPCVRRSTGNPGGPGHQWVKQRYIDPAPAWTPFPYTPQPDQPERTVTAVFIPSRLEDNLALQANDPEYESRLAATGGQALYRAWRYGDWNVAVGAVFSEWRTDLHVTAPTFTVPVHWRWAGGLDWGYRDPSVFVLCASDEERNVVVVREGVWKQTVARDVGKAIGRMCGQAGPNPVEYIAADDAMWSQSGLGYPSIAEEVQAGINDAYDGPGMAPQLIAAGKGKGSRLVRVSLLHEYLRWKAEQNGVVQPWNMPRLRFTPTCATCINTIPTLPIDETNPEDVDTDADDHAYDALTYFLMSRPREASWALEAPDQDRHPGIRKVYAAQIAATKKEPDWGVKYVPGKQTREAGW